VGRPKATEHGTYAYGRANKCECAPCRLAVSRYQKGVKLDHARGVKRRVPAEPARRKVQSFLDAGARPNQIQKAVGFHDAVFTHLMGGTRGRPPAEFIERTTAQKIARVTLREVLDVPTLSSSAGVIRRIQALQYMGHSPHTIAAAVGVSTAQLYQYTWAEQCYTKSINAVHAAYVELRDEQGTSGFARWKAYREGWAPPMSWDDETIDDPDMVPFPPACIVEGCAREAAEANLCSSHARRVREGGGFKESRRYRVVVQRIAAVSTSRRGDVRSLVLDLLEMGFSDPVEIAKRLGVTREFVDGVKKEVAA
jgi:hypothetical protein